MQNNVSLLTILSLAFMTYSHIQAMNSDSPVQKFLADVRHQREANANDLERQARRKAALDALRKRPSEESVIIEGLMNRILSGQETHPTTIFAPGSQTAEEMAQTLFHNQRYTIHMLPSREGVSKELGMRVLGMPIVGPIMLLPKSHSVGGTEQTYLGLADSNVMDE
jgi:hypothetical protein